VADPRARVPLLTTAVVCTPLKARPRRMVVIKFTDPSQKSGPHALAHVRRCRGRHWRRSGRYLTARISSAKP
jgi:hypothetical protein